MNGRAILIVPAVLAMAVLAGCGVTESGSAGGSGSGSTRIQMPSTEVCHLPAWIRERAPEGVCTSPEPVDDYLSPLKPARPR